MLGAEELTEGDDVRRSSPAARAQVANGEQLVTRMWSELLPCRDGSLRLCPRPLDRKGRDLVDRRRPEREVRDDPEVATASAAQSPEQVPVLRRGTADCPAGREHDPRRAKPVACQSELPRREADAAAERQAGDPDGRAAARRNREPVLPERVVDVDQACACADGRGTTVRSDVHAGDAAQVDHDARCRRVAAVAMTAAARHDVDVVLARPTDALLHVRDRLAEDNRPRVDAVEAGADE